MLIGATFNAEGASQVFLLFFNSPKDMRTSTHTHTLPVARIRSFA